MTTVDQYQDYQKTKLEGFYQFKKKYQKDHLIFHINDEKDSRDTKDQPNKYVGKKLFKPM